ncbi:MAG TPA: hypothetical protein VMR92_07595 [Gemmatimonadales bacterium]|nr:hypothetical protein [Gemmatimonadales bacterium]
MRTIAAAGVLSLLAYSDALAPLTVGAVYQLRSINGQPLPWSPPPSDSVYIPAKVTEGWIAFLDASSAQRHERLERWVPGVSGDSTLLVTDWTETAAYQRLSGKIALTYPPTPGGGSGVDTLYLGPRGSLILRQTGYLSPLDTIVRHFCVSGC